jgi:uncharacterized protein (DUF1778 family)
MEKTDTARLRLTPDEKAAFQEAAKIAGVSFSTWARQTLRRAAIREFHDAGRRLDFYPPRGRANDARNNSL